MQPYCNLHTHTNFSDGKNTPEEMVREAIRLGMESIGFSEHSPTPYGMFGMKPELLPRYREEVLRLKEAYRDSITVFLGIEQDSFAGIPVEPYDYVIGSVHYLFCEGERIPIDDTADCLWEATKKHFGGDIYALTRAYFRSVAEVVERTGCDIVGHFDLVTKFNEGGVMFDEKDYRYRRPALDALDALLEKDVRFEINTGAIARGYRRTPYPAAWALRRIAEKKGRVVLNADAHAAGHLQCFFPESVLYAHSCGVGGMDVLTKDGWRTVPI